ncbi:phage tail assembly chaperone [Geoanaerobacter pelophilus]
MPDEPPMPAEVEHIWTWFQELSATRGGGFGPAPITYQEIEAWSRLTGNRPTPWEVTQIKMLDAEYFAWQDEKAEKETSSGQ